MTEENQKKAGVTTRPPIVVVMGHIDHGKTTLLDKIRATNVAGRESGGITQHIGAYEALAKTKDGEERKITFIDTPGHEAFSKMRSRGARAADIAILVVAADDGVKPQTIEALGAIKESEVPFVVAINKIDKGGADPERVKKELAERGVYLEGWGGQVPVVKVSAKSGEGLDELLETILLVADLEADKLSTDLSKQARGVVIESHLDPRRGKSATLLILDGKIKQGDYIAAGRALSPVRIFENFEGRAIKEAGPSQPVVVVGFSGIPEVGSKFAVFTNKALAENAAKETEGGVKAGEVREIKTIGKEEEKEITIIPLVLKADSTGSLEAMENEIVKIQRERLLVKILRKETGPVSEDDVALAASGQSGVVLGFKVKEEKNVEQAAERFAVKIKTFEIIYELFDWLKEYIESELPLEKTEEIIGRARILKIFSQKGAKQIVGGVALGGQIKDKSKVRIYRREKILAFGKIIELQQAKIKSETVNEGSEFGVMIESPIEIAPRDEIEAIEEKIVKIKL